MGRRFRARGTCAGSTTLNDWASPPIDSGLHSLAVTALTPGRAVLFVRRSMDDRRKLEHQIDLATRAAALASDQTTVQRFGKFAEELRQKLRQIGRHPKVRSRAYELWEESGRPPHRDLEFWLEAERQIKEKRKQD